MVKKPKAEPKPPKRGRGRPPHVPTEALKATVKIMVAGGIQHEHVAACLGIDRETLRRHYRFELANGKAQANAQVVARLFKMTDGNVRAAEFWLTNQAKANWAHTQKVAVDQRDVTDLGDRLQRAQEKFRKAGK